MLAWHNIWMAQHGRELASHLKSAGNAVTSGAKPPIALAIVVAIAVLREGAEVVLFLYGVAISHKSALLDIALGGVIGLALGVAVSGLTFLGLVKIPARMLFAVTGLLIAFLAAGMAAQCVAFLEQGGLVDVLGASAWDTSSILAQGSVPGRLLHALIGYVDQPSWLQLLAYGIVLFGILALSKIVAPKAAPRAAGGAKPAGVN
jgi:high-affinity iron transporter